MVNLVAIPHPCLPILQVAIDQAILDNSEGINLLDSFRLDGLCAGEEIPDLTIDILKSHKAASGFLPVPAFSIRKYLASMPELDQIIALGLDSPLKALAHFLHYGVWRGAVFIPAILQPSETTLLKTGFDVNIYEQSLSDAGIKLPPGLSPIKHYLGAGLCLGLEVSHGYCEASYLLRYTDIVHAISRKVLLNGYLHFLRYGLEERRDASRLTEGSYIQAFYPGLAKGRHPADAVNTLSRFTLSSSCLPAKISQSSIRSLLLCLHAIDTEIKFGGMSAFYRIVDAIVSRFSPAFIDIVLTDQPGGLAGACYQINKPNHPLREYSSIIRLHCLVNVDDDKTAFALNSSPTVGHNVIAIAYNAKAAYILNHFKVRCESAGFKWMYLIQEDESTFFGGSSLSAIVRHTYTFDCIPIYNSNLLASYMKARYPAASLRYETYFSHQYILPEHPVKTSEKQKIIVCYYRPEAHADRNCHELIAMSLGNALRQMPSLLEWTILGVGSFYEYSIDLGAGVSMRCLPKMAYHQYSDLLRVASIGISLMDAPHPSVVPFEMAGHGVIAITNTYTNRDHQDIRQISPNDCIRTCELNCKSISEAIIAAVEYCETRQVPPNNVCAQRGSPSLSTRWNKELEKLMHFIDTTYSH